MAKKDLLQLVKSFEFVKCIYNGGFEIIRDVNLDDKQGYLSYSLYSKKQDVSVAHEPLASLYVPDTKEHTTLICEMRGSKPNGKLVDILRNLADEYQFPVHFHFK